MKKLVALHSVEIVRKTRYNDYKDLMPLFVNLSSFGDGNSAQLFCCCASNVKEIVSSNNIMNEKVIIYLHNEFKMVIRL